MVAVCSWWWWSKRCVIASDLVTEHDGFLKHNIIQLDLYDDIKVRFQFVVFSTRFLESIICLALKPRKERFHLNFHLFGSSPIHDWYFDHFLKFKIKRLDLLDHQSKDLTRSQWRTWIEKESKCLSRLRSSSTHRTQRTWSPPRSLRSVSCFSFPSLSSNQSQLNHFLKLINRYRAGERGYVFPYGFTSKCRRYHQSDDGNFQFVPPWCRTDERPLGFGKSPPHLIQPGEYHWNGPSHWWKPEEDWREKEGYVTDGRFRYIFIDHGPPVFFEMFCFV